VFGVDEGEAFVAALFGTAVACVAHLALLLWLVAGPGNPRCPLDTKNPPLGAGFGWLMLRVLSGLQPTLRCRMKKLII
jgi:hypothetical protein